MLAENTAVTQIEETKITNILSPTFDQDVTVILPYDHGCAAMDYLRTLGAKVGNSTIHAEWVVSYLNKDVVIFQTRFDYIRAAIALAADAYQAEVDAQHRPFLSRVA